MSLTKTDKIFIAGAALFGGYVCYALVMMNEDKVPGWYAAYAFLFLSLCAAVWGLLNCKRWAYFLGLGLALMGLGLGVYLLHFAWTFWLFKDPTLLDRIQAVFHPRIFVFTLIPVLWLAHCLNPAARARFLGEHA